MLSLVDANKISPLNGALSFQSGVRLRTTPAVQKQRVLCNKSDHTMSTEGSNQIMLITSINKDCSQRTRVPSLLVIEMVR